MGINWMILNFYDRIIYTINKKLYVLSLFSEFTKE